MARFYEVEFRERDIHGNVIDTFQARENLDDSNGDDMFGKAKAWAAALFAAKVAVEFLPPDPDQTRKD